MSKELQKLKKMWFQTLKVTMEEKRISKRKIAGALKITPSKVDEIVKEDSNPSLEVMFCLASVLGCELKLVLAQIHGLTMDLNPQSYGDHEGAYAARDIEGDIKMWVRLGAKYKTSEVGYHKVTTVDTDGITYTGSGRPGGRLKVQPHRVQMKLL